MISETFFVFVHTGLQTARMGRPLTVRQVRRRTPSSLPSFSTWLSSVFKLLRLLSYDPTSRRYTNLEHTSFQNSELLFFDRRIRFFSTPSRLLSAGDDDDPPPRPYAPELVRARPRYRRMLLVRHSSQVNPRETVPSVNFTLDSLVMGAFLLF